MLPCIHQNGQQKRHKCQGTHGRHQAQMRTTQACLPCTLKLRSAFTTAAVIFFMSLTALDRSVRPYHLRKEGQQKCRRHQARYTTRAERGSDYTTQSSPTCQSTSCVRIFDILRPTASCAQSSSVIVIFVIIVTVIIIIIIIINGSKSSTPFIITTFTHSATTARGDPASAGP